MPCTEPTRRVMPVPGRRQRRAVQVPRGTQHGRENTRRPGAVAGEPEARALNIATSTQARGGLRETPPIKLEIPGLWGSGGVLSKANIPGLWASVD
ncbi:hypothetical protein THICB2_640117 [Thiomonas sp. CB2]|nr:hypothetical protein THICB2_640117 [Thiomonas sp. CB2]VDY03715.1 protein of unknown function [Thiomonas sp. Bio17B3]VDY09109.1 protein of unknown function [Thiomonas sp. Sup16B3]VDY11964.1 conserved protein of unknown function [Thiomonas sp. OC7]VDY18819.1 protein of unknown function [Thiomonas sp. CB2]